MRTAPLLFYVSLGSITLGVLAELLGLNSVLAPHFSEGTRILLAAAATFAGFAATWIYFRPEEDDECA